MHRSEWYVVQVETGRERNACQVIQRVCESGSNGGPEGENILEECFSPTYEYRRKQHGEWVTSEMLLLPGYVIAVTRDPWKLEHALRRTPAFTRLLSMGMTFLTLSADDRSWIENWTTQGNRTIPMSVAYKEGDKIVVTDGPLVGQEAMIVRVNRRKRVAHLEIHAGQLTIHTTVGLEVLPKHEEGFLC